MSLRVRRQAWTGLCFHPRVAAKPGATTRGSGANGIEDEGEQGRKSRVQQQAEKPALALHVAIKQRQERRNETGRGATRSQQTRIKRLGRNQEGYGGRGGLPKARDTGGVPA
eukprot:2321508-Rhodomonas_salina.4